MPPVGAEDIAYHLADRGPPVLPPLLLGWCWWCGDARHRGPNGACPLRYVRVSDLTPARQALIAAGSSS